MFGHMTDVGGKVPGSLPTDARTIFEEGIAVPPVKIYPRRASCSDDVLNIILHNCRLPHWNRSDFHAIVAALRTAERRVRRDHATASATTRSISAMDEMLERNKRAMPRLIQQIVPGEAAATSRITSTTTAWAWARTRSPARMWREGDKCIFDFTGTDPQSISSINFLLNEEMFKMFVGRLHDHGVRPADPVQRRLLRSGRGAHSRGLAAEAAVKPAALSCRTHALGRIFDVLGGLLGQGDPDVHVRRRLLGQPAFHVFRLQQGGRVVPALPDRLRRHSRPSRSATGRTGIRCGRRSPTCRTNSSRATSRCASTPTRRSPTPAAPACIPRRQRHPHRLPCSSSRARSRSTTTAG